MATSNWETSVSGSGPHCAAWKLLALRWIALQQGAATTLPARDSTASAPPLLCCVGVVSGRVPACPFPRCRLVVWSPRGVGSGGEWSRAAQSSGACRRRGRTRSARANHAARIRSAPAHAIEAVLCGSAARSRAGRLRWLPARPPLEERRLHAPAHSALSDSDSREPSRAASCDQADARTQRSQIDRPCC